VICMYKVKYKKINWKEDGKLFRRVKFWAKRGEYDFD
jgi:hypothetical protein